MDTIEDGAQAGYLMLAPLENDWSEDRIPDEWRDRNGRLKPSWPTACRRLCGQPNGDFFTMPHAGASSCVAARAISLCLNCGEFYSRRELEFAKLRRYPVKPARARPPCLRLHCSAAPQAWKARGTNCSHLRTIGRTHRCNPVISTISSTSPLLRCALHAALQRDNELTFDRVAEAVVAASGLTVHSVAKNPELDPVSPAAMT